MRIAEPKFVPSPDGVSSFPQWLQLAWHPAEKNKVYTVKNGLHGEPYTAFLSSDYQWFKVLPDANGDGTRELGEKMRTTLDLYYVAHIRG